MVNRDSSQIQKEASEIQTLIKNCRERLIRYFDNDFKYIQLPVPNSNKFLRKHISEKLPMFVLYVDMIGSTKMSSNMSPDELSTIIRSFCQEMACIIEHYDGYVLKFVGDAAIGYFITGDKTQLMAANTAKCARAMIKVIEEGMNPVIKRQDYPEIKVKITADFGVGSIILYSSNKRRAHIDIIGMVLNLAAKMQSMAKPNQIILGEQIYTKLPPRLKSSFKKVSTTSKWNPTFTKKHSYSIFAG